MQYKCVPVTEYKAAVDAQRRFVLVECSDEYVIYELIRVLERMNISREEIFRHGAFTKTGSGRED